MSSNKKVREELERRYGKECFIDKLHLRKDKKRRYKGKAQMKRMKQLTYHHILEKRNRRKSHSREWGIVESAKIITGFIDKMQMCKDI